MTHEQKVAQAIAELKSTILPKIFNQLGGVGGFAQMIALAGAFVVVTIEAEAAAATTGVGLALDGFVDVVGAVVLAARLINDYGILQNIRQVGKGIVCICKFYQATQCNRAQTEKELKIAGQQFAEGVADIGAVATQQALALLLAARAGKAEHGADDEPVSEHTEGADPLDPIAAGSRAHLGCGERVDDRNAGRRQLPAWPRRTPRSRRRLPTRIRKESGRNGPTDGAR